MDTSAIVQVIKEAAASHGCAKESEKAQLVEACSTLISSLESPEQKLMTLILGVSIFARGVRDFN